MPDNATLPKSFVDAVAACDAARIADLLAPDVRFRALIPSALREASNAAETADWFVRWFADSTELRVVDVTSESMSDRVHIGYRIQGVEDGKSYVVEQQAYCDVEDGKIRDLSLVCSGFRPAPDDVHAVHTFDAGNMGCTDGLPQEFRRRIMAIPVGDTLRVVARDPSAKADLPSLARMMGHRIEAVEEEGGVLTITVERMK